MTVIRRLTIEHLRGIERLVWQPKAGVNCLVGHGDSGKSTILDAIEWCLSARGQLRVSDADFYCLDTSNPIRIAIVLGALDGDFLKLDRYGDFLRGFDIESNSLEDEPREKLDTVLELQLEIRDDLEPEWRLLSDRIDPESPARTLSWSDRIKIEPIRIGAYSTTHLGWRRGSILERLTDESAKAPAALAEATRAARTSFGRAADAQLARTLEIANVAAQTVGLDNHGDLCAALDAHAIALSGGSLSLHDGRGVPLKNLGLGSSRILVAELQNQAGESTSISLIDEVEQGLEPHRIKRLLDALGVKAIPPQAQQFITTHSPAVVRELTANQLHLVQRKGAMHTLVSIHDDDAQGTLRLFPDAFLGRRILICEGATEVGLLRGLDRYFVEKLDEPAFTSEGAVSIDAGSANKIYRPARILQSLQYEVAVLRDDDADEQIDHNAENTFLEKEGTLFKWPNNHSLETELFMNLAEDAIVAMYRQVEADRGATLARDNLKYIDTALDSVDQWLEHIDGSKRQHLSNAALKFGWFKSISLMESAAYKIIGPNLNNAGDSLNNVINAIFVWANPKYWAPEESG